MTSAANHLAGRLGESPAKRRRRSPRDIALAIGIVGVTAALGVALALAYNAAVATPSGAIVAPISAGPPEAQSSQSSNPSVVAEARGKSVAVFATPSSPKPSEVLKNPTSTGDPVVFLTSGPMVGSTWIRVYLPSRPNQSQGWVRSDAVTLSADDYLVHVNLSAHQMTVFNAGLVMMSIKIGEGRSALPTPTGTYFIVDLLKQPDPVGGYGPYAFGLSAYSDVLQSFGGGPGEIGIHGTDVPQSVGASLSHGCIRVSDATIVALAELLPLGTPVLINH
ncbi:MAG TPA: L,D-transpeptidase [Acidimicrobiales bacterium]